jgi:hypothetical protein
MLEAAPPAPPGAVQSVAANNVPGVTTDGPQKPPRRDGTALTYGDIADEIERSM